MNEETSEPAIRLEQHPSIKLIKTAKGYNWEVRILSIDVKAIKKVNDEMIAEFGGGE